MKRRQFLALACAITAFADACKSDEPIPATTVQGYITDSQGQPVVGLEVMYIGSGGGNNGILPSTPSVSFSEKTLTDVKGFFKITKVVPRGIDVEGTQIYLSDSVYKKYTNLESIKNGIVISNQYNGPILVAKSFNIQLGTVNEYLVTLK